MDVNALLDKLDNNNLATVFVFAILAASAVAISAVAIFSRCVTRVLRGWPPEPMVLREDDKKP